jgi:hypothetical protein
MNTAKPQAVQQERAEIAEDPETSVASVSSCSTLRKPVQRPGNLCSVPGFCGSPLENWEASRELLGWGQIGPGCWGRAVPTPWFWAEEVRRLTRRRGGRGVGADCGRRAAPRACVLRQVRRAGLLRFKGARRNSALAQTLQPSRRTLQPLRGIVHPRRGIIPVPGATLSFPG